MSINCNVMDNVPKELYEGVLGDGEVDLDVDGERHVILSEEGNGTFLVYVRINEDGKTLCQHVQWGTNYKRILASILRIIADHMAPKYAPF